MSPCPELAEAFSVCPSCAVPVMIGVVIVGTASSTAEVAALVAETVTPFSLVAVATHLDLEAFVAFLGLIARARGAADLLVAAGRTAVLQPLIGDGVVALPGAGGGVQRLPFLRRPGDGRRRDRGRRIVHRDRGGGVGGAAAVVSDRHAAR